MKKEILERYARTDDGRFIIDIATDKVEYLFNNFDRNAPYVRKELDQDLVDYLIDCMREIDDEKIMLQFSIAEPVSQDLVDRLQTGIHNYFLYLRELEMLELRKLGRRFMIFLLIGFSIMTLSVWVNDNLDHASAFNRVLAEGLTVAAWVSMWEAVSTFLINWTPHRYRLKWYRKIAMAPVTFSHSIQGKEDKSCPGGREGPVVTGAVP